MSNSVRHYQSNSTVQMQPAMGPLIREIRQDADLSTYLHILYLQRWLIACVVFVALLLGTTYAFFAAPVYEANVLIHVEEESPKESRNLLSESGSMFSMKTSASAEIELLQSRLVISHAIDKLNLAITGEPVYLPVVGRLLARYNNDIAPPAWLSERGYAWGRESIQIETFSVPESFMNRKFELILIDQDHFHITEPDSGLVANGRIGEQLVVTLPPGKVELLVRQISGRPGTRFQLVHMSRQLLIDETLKSMQVSEQGKQSGIVKASLQGSDPEKVNNLLGEIAKSYINQNTARKRQEADTALAFLEKQMPDLKAQLDLSETRYADFRNVNSMVDLGEEGKISLQQSALLKTRRIELQQKRNELLIRFTPEHPFVTGIDAQLADVNGEIRKMAAHIKKLPLLEQELIRLSRDVKVNSDLYTALLNTARQLKLTTVAKTSNVRLVDMPLKPEKPISPRRARIIGASLLAGLMLGVAGAVTRKSLQAAIEDPAEIEHVLGMPMYASIPHSRTQAESLSNATTDFAHRPLLACTDSSDAAVESLRSFRTVLQYKLSNLDGKVVMITGPNPGAGKSFVSANLAVLLAAGGKRVILIDGDLRNGELHTDFGFERHSGLSDVLTHRLHAEEVIRKEVLPNLDFMSTGALPANSSELLMQPVLGTLLSMLETKYDIVLIDSAPVLAVSDSIIIGMHAAAIYLLARPGMNTASEMTESVKRLNQAGLAPTGFLFNGVPLRRHYGYNYGYGGLKQA